MYFNGMFMLDLWNQDSNYAVFDDWEDWSKMYFYKSFLGAQKEFVLSDKYKRKQNVLWGKPSIIVANTMPCFQDWTWILANCFIVEIGSNKLY